MRIRELYFNNFRSFRGEHRISFVDPNTGMVRPVTVLAGSNGSGKTTVLETIEALLRLIVEPNKPAEILRQALHSSLVIMTVEVSDEEVNWIASEKKSLFIDLPSDLTFHFVVGNFTLESKYLDLIRENEPDNAYGIMADGSSNLFLGNWPSFLAEKLRDKLSDIRNLKDNHILGGLLYFPFDRQLGKVRMGAIERPKSKNEWVFRYTTPNRWQGSLEQLWVWQNYLDLEKGTDENTNLAPFVESVENVLGEYRKVSIEQGQVYVPVGWTAKNGDTTNVTLDQLPSGEQQVLLLFGELARWRRKDVVIAIDEVENSLHPTLQRLVMWNLRRLAREWDAQVIVATHSLEVINSVRGGAFINLDYPESRFNLPLPEEETEGV